MSKSCRVALSAASLAALAITFVALPAAAQVDDEVISGLQFNFTPPGARSLGVGGAFLAVANDATAAYTNPAGLTNLSEQEVSIEGRNFSTSTLFSDAGRFNGTPLDRGVDTRSGFSLGESDDEVTSLSFISYVRPVGDFRFALFRHQLVDFESSFETGGVFFDPEGVCCRRLFPVQTSLGLEIENIGASFAYEFADRFSIGIGVNFYSFDIASTTFRYDVSPAVPDLDAPGGFFGPPDFSPSNVFATQVQRGDDDQVGINVGFLFEVNQHFSLGGVYREGKDFDYDYTISCGPADPAFCRTVPGLESGARTVAATFGTPSVFGLGIAIRPTDTFTITLDYDNVEYSALVDNLTVAAVPQADPDDFVVDDADEIHLGFEYVFATLANPIYLRAGAWEDPAHQIRYEGPVPEEAIALWAGSQAADDEMHYSFGVGFAIGESFSLDLAADFSERADIAALSAVYRF
ncbi:MAG TPA: outer membrane protein transport protein [Thermoanaerobaculia bacterium]|nr:outer membrane protein transport protein [Thermoanaerobaculia bacterium]